MTLIEDARQLAGPIGTSCDFCMGSPISGHFDVCPMLSLLKIVAVLEVAERLSLVQPCPQCGAWWPEHQRQWCETCMLTVTLWGGASS